MLIKLFCCFEKIKVCKLKIFIEKYRKLNLLKQIDYCGLSYLISLRLNQYDSQNYNKYHFLCMIIMINCSIDKIESQIFFKDFIKFA